MKERPTNHDRPEDTVDVGTTADPSEDEGPEDGGEESMVEAEDDGSGADEPDEITALRAEFNELNDRHMRLAAEFNNFRRRSEQERQESWSRAQADLLARVLDVLDDLQRVAELDASSTTVEALVEGVDLVERKFGRVLEDAGVEIIDPHEDVFDPERMEAIMRVPAESEEMDDHVAEVFQKGYALKGVLVRPARVSVFKHG